MMAFVFIYTPRNIYWCYPLPLLKTLPICSDKLNEHNSSINNKTYSEQWTFWMFSDVCILPHWSVFYRLFHRGRPNFAKANLSQFNYLPLKTKSKPCILIVLLLTFFSKSQIQIRTISGLSNWREKQNL